MGLTSLGSPLKQSATEAAVTAVTNLSNIMFGKIGVTTMMALGGWSVAQSMADLIASPTARGCLAVGNFCGVISGLFYPTSAATRSFLLSAGIMLGGVGLVFYYAGKTFVALGDKYFW
uniref:hypothetical protein n=1 Tax=Fibrocapsa japonica TaxID=94617 RepID=UPI00211542C6|nr:hypothetical protein NQZ09_pgp105 [Fibrocapsa japonica]UTE95200.1 hypothetical protein FjapPt_p119 [Fibrocapsa japonica]